MNILIDINHPAHVHLMRNAYSQLVEHGHNIIVTVKEIPSALELLDLYGIPYINIGKKDDTLGKKGFDQFVYDLRILKIVHENHVDIGIGTSINIPHVSKLSRMKSVILDDDDDDAEALFVKFCHPFADVILTPSSISRKSKRAVYVDAFHELAYLHPNRFSPDEAVLREVGVEKGEPFFVLRFNAFKAYHDIGASGLSTDNQHRLVESLKRKGKVFITTERGIDDELKPYQLKISPEKTHSLLYYATMFIGDSQTMTSEAAVLGTPALKCNSFSGQLSVPNELERKYGLCYSFLPEQSDAFFSKIDELLAMPNLKQEWQNRRRRMLTEKIDYTGFLVWYVENFPRSKQVMVDNRDFQSRFK